MGGRLGEWTCALLLRTFVLDEQVAQAPLGAFNDTLRNSVNTCTSGASAARRAAGAKPHTYGN